MVESKKIKVSKKLQDIILVNERIIDSLKASKARNDKNFERYQKRIIEYTNIPSNRFMDWVKVIEPFIDIVVSAKMTDFDYIDHLTDYVKSLVLFEEQQLIDEQDLNESHECVDNALDVIYRLEIKIKALNEELLQLRNTNEELALKVDMSGKNVFLNKKTFSEKKRFNTNLIIAHNFIKNEEGFIKGDH